MSVGQAIAQIEDAGQQFQNQAHSVKLEAEQASHGFIKAGETARDEAGVLNEASHKISIDTEQLVTRVQEEAASLLENAESTLFDLRQAGDGFAVRSREVSEQLKQALSTTEKYGLEMQKQADLVAKSSVMSVDKIHNSTQNLKKEIQDIEKNCIFCQ